MLAFEGSPLKKLSLEDPDEHDAHENLLNTAMIKHLHVINWCMSDLGSRAFRMTPKMFMEEVYETSQQMLDNDEWGDFCFNRDVFGTVWEENFGHRFPELQSVIPFSPAHISIVQLEEKSRKDLAAQRAKLAAKEAESNKTKADLRKDKSKKKEVQFKSDQAARKKAAAVSFEGVDSDSSDENNDEIDLKVNTVGKGIISKKDATKKRKDTGPLYRGDHAITEASLAGIQQVRIEADDVFAQSKEIGISTSKRQKLLLTGAKLLAVVQKLTVEPPGMSYFGQTDSTGGGAAVAMNHLPESLKGVLDVNPAKNSMTVLKYFDQLDNVLVSQRSNAKVPFLMAGLTGRLLTKFKEECKLVGGIHQADFDSCRDWLEEQLFDPTEFPRMYEKFRALEQGGDDLDTFLTKVNVLRTTLAEHGQRPNHTEYKHQVLNNLNPATEALATQRPGFTTMGFKKKLVVLQACEKSIALSENISNKRVKGQVSAAASKKKLQKHGRKGKLARLVVEKNSDVDSDDDDTMVEVGSFTQGQLDNEINRRAQSIASKTAHNLQSADGKTKKMTKGEKKRAKLAAAAANGGTTPWKNKSGVDPRSEETISGHIGADTFSGGYKKTPDWSTKRAAHDKLVQNGTKKASDAPELYRYDRYKGKFACLLCRKTGHTQDNERCTA